MSQVVSDLLLVYHIRHLCCLAKEVKVLSDRLTSAKRIVVEGILVIIQLVSQAIIGIFKIDSDKAKLESMWRHAHL
jgi:hypothetical protein